MNTKKKLAAMAALFTGALVPTLFGIGFHNTQGKSEKSIDYHMAEVAVEQMRIGLTYRVGNPGEPKIDDDLAILAGLKGTDLFVTINTNTKAIPPDLEDFKDWVRQFVEHYDGDGDGDLEGGYVVKYIQLGNELDLDNHWKPSTKEADKWAEYATTLAAVHEAVKEASPKVDVVLAGARKSDASIQHYATQVLPAISQHMEETGQERLFDIVDIHNIDVGTYGLSYGKIQQALNGMEAALEAQSLHEDIRYVCTETSTWCGTQNGQKRSQKIQAQEVVKRLLYPLTLEFEFATWNLMTERDSFKGDSDNPFTRTALWDNPGNGQDDDDIPGPDEGPKLGYWSYRLLSNVLENVPAHNVTEVTGQVSGGGGWLPFVGRLVKIEDSPFLTTTLAYQQSSIQPDDVFVLWRDTSAAELAMTMTVTVEVGSEYDEVEVVSTVPVTEDYGVHIDSETWLESFSSEVIPVVDGKVTVQIGTVPLYLWPR